MQCILYIFLIFINYSTCKCIDSYLTICESVFDVTKNGRKHWTSMIVQSDKCIPASSNFKYEILRRETLEKCPNLEQLYIIAQLDGIEPKSFEILTNLQYLNLFENQLQLITSEIFSNLIHLNQLELKSNQIESIAPGTFKNTFKLTTINLSNNKLIEINEKIFDLKNFKKLVFQNNLITTIHPNVFGANLEILQIDNNQIKVLQENLFSNLIQLKELSLSRNKLKKLSKNAWNGLGKLFKLDLSHNEIDTIEVKVFDALQEMKLLQLAHNRLKSIKPDIFPKITNPMSLQSLRLDHNKMTYLSADVFDKLPSMRRISIGGNPWQCVCLQQIQTEMNNRNVSYTPCDYQHYFTGKNPTCMQLNSDKCVQNIEEVGDEFFKLYELELHNFSYDCP